MKVRGISDGNITAKDGRSHRLHPHQQTDQHALATRRNSQAFWLHICRQTLFRSALEDLHNSVKIKYIHSRYILLASSLLTTMSAATQTFPRRSLCSKCHTVSRYTSQYKLIYVHKRRKAPPPAHSPRPILKKFANYLCISPAYRM